VDGEVDLTNGVRLRDPGDYQVTSAPAIFKDLVITRRCRGPIEPCVDKLDARMGSLAEILADQPTYALHGLSTAATGAGERLVINQVLESRAQR